MAVFQPILASNGTVSPGGVAWGNTSRLGLLEDKKCAVGGQHASLTSNLEVIF